VTSAAAKPAPPSYGRIYVAGVALVAILAAFIWAASRWLPMLQVAWFDLCQVLLPRTVASTPAIVVEIDEKSLARFGQWPWPRTVLAELVRAVERGGPAAIGIDILMPEPDRMSPDRWFAAARERDPVLEEHLRALPSSDAELARAIAAGPVVVGVAGTPDPTARQPTAPPFVVVDRAASPRHADAPLADIQSHAGALTNIEQIDRAASGHGAISAGHSDRVIRRLPLVTRIKDRLVPSMPLEMLRVALGAGEIRVYARGAAVDTIAVGDFVVPTESDGELRIYYSDPNARPYVSAVDVLDGKADASNFSRTLVLVGIRGLAMVDYQNTPLGRMPGSEIHAQILENLVDQTWLKRPSWAVPLELVVFALLGLALVWTTPRWKPGHAALLATVAIAFVLAFAFGAFLWRRLEFDAASPAIGLLVLFSALLLLTLSEAARQRRRLERVIQTQREQAAYISGELEAAKRIQTGYLPRSEALATETRVEVAATMTPAREVGGDLYDFFKLDADRLFLLIGDVAGKGLSASMFMAVTKALYKSNALRGPNARVSDLMRAANGEISRDNPEMFFVTAFAAVLDLDSGRIAYCNAGHDCPYVLGPGGREPTRLDAEAGPPLCAVEGYEYRDAVQRLDPGQIICLTTDGVVDTRDPQDARYGGARLQRLLGQLGVTEQSARAVVDAITADVGAYAAGAEPADDLTVLAVRWIGRG
jgi:serine phosphatase RsbU (regulator of sigma subunit)